MRVWGAGAADEDAGADGGWPEQADRWSGWDGGRDGGGRRGKSEETPGPEGRTATGEGA